jgi:hypothetical protein
VGCRCSSGPIAEVVSPFEWSPHTPPAKRKTCSHTLRQLKTVSSRHSLHGGGVQVPSRIEGGVNIRNTRLNVPFGAGNQFDSFSCRHVCVRRSFKCRVRVQTMS